MTEEIPEELKDAIRQAQREHDRFSSYVAPDPDKEEEAIAADDRFQQAMFKIAEFMLTPDELLALHPELEEENYITRDEAAHYHKPTF